MENGNENRVIGGQIQFIHSLIQNEFDFILNLFQSLI